LLTGGPLLDTVHEVLGHLEMHVRVEQSIADFFRGLFDVVLRNAAPAGEVPEHLLHSVGEAFEHDGLKTRNRLREEAARTRWQPAISSTKISAARLPQVGLRSRRTIG